MSPEALEVTLHRIGAERYDSLHPFHKLHRVRRSFARPQRLGSSVGLFRNGHGNLNAGIPRCEIIDVRVTQLLSDHRHDLMGALARSERLELRDDIDLAFARDVRGARYPGQPVDAMARLAHLGFLPSEGRIPRLCAVRPQHCEQQTYGRRRERVTESASSHSGP